VLVILFLFARGFQVGKAQQQEQEYIVAVAAAATVAARVTKENEVFFVISWTELVVLSKTARP
jgi:hypothetical protein